MGIRLRRDLRGIVVVLSLLASALFVVGTAPPAHAGYIGVTVTIKGAGTVHAIRGGTFSCTRNNNFNDNAESTCPRHTHEEVFEAVVELRPTPADFPSGNSDWRFSHWEGCQYIITGGDVPVCQVWSDMFGANERAPKAVFTDAVAPGVTITSGPSNQKVSSTSATFGFSSNDPLAGFRCKLDGAPYTACSSPVTYSSLTQGSHTFRVYALDPSGNATPTDALRTWTVDTVPPTAQINSAPPSRTNVRDAMFTFSANEPGVLQCRLDAAPFAACPGGSAVYPGLPDGVHTFEVRAMDEVGNLGSAAAHTWTIDTVAPDTTILTGPSGLTSETAPTFTFSGEPAGDTASYECRIDDEAWSACSGNGTHTTATLAGGAHTFQVRAVDATNNADQTPALRMFEVMTEAPQTTIRKGPSGKTRDRTPTFRFGSSPSGAAFQCKLDKGAWRPCASPYTTKRLTYGKHVLRVRSELVGLVDATPAVQRFKVVRR